MVYRPINEYLALFIMDVLDSSGKGGGDDSGQSRSDVVVQDSPKLCYKQWADHLCRGCDQDIAMH